MEGGGRCSWRIWNENVARTKHLTDICWSDYPYQFVTHPKELALIRKCKTFWRYNSFIPFSLVKVANTVKARWSLDVSHCPAGNVSSRNGWAWIAGYIRNGQIERFGSRLFDFWVCSTILRARPGRTVQWVIVISGKQIF